MKNLFNVCFSENTIIASKTTLKKASNPKTEEYKMLMKLMKKHPTFTVNEKVINQKEGKKTYKGLNKDFIKRYISIQENADKLKAEYTKAFEMGQFPLARKWFLNKFKDFKMEKAIEEIENVLLEQIASAAKPATNSENDAIPELDQAA